MALTPEQIKKILKLWLDIEFLTPFDIKENDFNEDPNSAPDKPRTSLFKWDNKNKVGLQALHREMAQVPVGTDSLRYFSVYTVCLGIIAREVFVRRVEELLSKLSLKHHDFNLDYNYEQLISGDKFALGSVRVNHFGKHVVNSLQVSYAFAFLVMLTEKVEGKSRGFGTIRYAEEIFTATRNKYWPEYYGTTAYEGTTETAPQEGDRQPYSLLARRIQSKTKEKNQKQLWDLNPSRPVQNPDDFDKIVQEWLGWAGLHTDYEIWAAKQYQVSMQEIEAPFMNSPYVFELTRLISQLEEGGAPDEVFSDVSKRFFDKAYGSETRNDILTDPAQFAELVNPTMFGNGRWPNALDHFLDPLQQAAVESICSSGALYPIVSVNGPPGTGKTEMVKELVADQVVRRALQLRRIPNIAVAELFKIVDFPQTGPVRVLKDEYAEDFAILVASNNNNAVENITKELPYSYSYDRAASYFPELADRVNHTQGAWGFISAALGNSKNWYGFQKALFKFDKPQTPTGTERRTDFLTHYFSQCVQREGGQQEVWKKWEAERGRFNELVEKAVSVMADESKKYKADLKKLRNSSKTQPQKAISGLRDLFMARTESSEDSDPTQNPFNFVGEAKAFNEQRRVYSSEAGDRVRTELFLSALELHRLTILSHYKKFANAIQKCCEVNRRNESSVYRAQSLETICFFIPVVSTTFAASVFRFSSFNKKSIPWVVVDEASQATPQSAIVLMQRAKRLIVLGDPQQLEPVVPLPYSIVEMLMAGDSFLKQWISPQHSLQTLADGTQEYGAWMETGGRKRWTGLPLRVQRRSYPPMFTICNSISYDGQMTLSDHMMEKRAEHPPMDGFWFDVVPRVKSQTNLVPDEIDALSELLDWIDVQLDAEYTVFDQTQKTVMLCSPFRAVANALSRGGIRQKRRNFKVVKSGTVHTLQGRQADIVILILGSKTGKAGFNARSWACNPPRLLNVAVSRAKETLFVVGNFEDWQSFTAVSEILNGLESFGKGLVRELP